MYSQVSSAVKTSIGESNFVNAKTIRCITVCSPPSQRGIDLIAVQAVLHRIAINRAQLNRAKIVQQSKRP